MLLDAPLGKNSVYIETYSPGLLYPVSRALSRDKLGITHMIPFDGKDVWNGYELSWLNGKGKPQMAYATFIFPCTSPFIVESKSFKLYLNSFNQSKFDSIDSVQKTIEHDLSAAAKDKVEVILSEEPPAMKEFTGICLDDLDSVINCYHHNADLLKIQDEFAQETLYTNLFKSNCLATGQPDWGSVRIHYCGKKIDHESLLRYFISFRSHSGFAEHCVEQIYYDLMQKCAPDKLSVYARYTRRGGLDINPFRSNFEPLTQNFRLLRQ